MKELELNLDIARKQQDEGADFFKFSSGLRSLQLSPVSEKVQWMICHLLLLYLSLSMIWYFLWNELAKHGDAIASHLKLLITDWPTRIDRGNCKVMLSPLKSFFYNLQVVFRVQWLSYLLAPYTWLPSHTTVDTYRVVFLTGPSKIFLSIRLHSKSHQKVLSVWIYLLAGT